MNAEKLRALAADGAAEGISADAIRERLRAAAADAGARIDLDAIMAEFVRVARFAEFVPLHDLPVPDFPTDALPTWLCDFASKEAEATQTPPDLAGMLGLAAVATAVGGLARVAPNGAGYSEPLNLYVAIALPPASRKSQAFADAVAPILAWERERVVDARPIVARALEQLEQERERLKELRKKAPKDAEAERAGQELAARIAEVEARLPVLPRRVTDDVTPETLAGLLHAHHGRIAVWSAEGGELFEVMRGRYSGNSRPNMGVFLKGHAGDALAVDRRRERYFVERPTLTVAAAIQTDALTALRDATVFRERGLLARFLYVVPEPTVGTRTWPAPPLSEKVRKEYEGYLGRLLRLSPAAEPALVELTPAALELWLAFARTVEPRLAEGGDLRGMADWAGKLPGAVLRLAGVLHAAEWADQPDPFGQAIDETTIERAIRLGEYALGHARRVFAALDCDEKAERAGKLWRTIARARWPRFSRRDLWQRVKGGRIGSLDDLDAALGLLESHGYVSRIGGTGGNPRREEYAVNPEALGFGGNGGSPSREAGRETEGEEEV